MSEFLIKIASSDKYTRLGEIMFEAVRSGDSPYTELQRSAWMPKPREGREWNERLKAQHILMAQNSDDEIVGFMSLKPDGDEGYVDFAYILLAARGQGLFRRLYSQIETQAKALRFKALSTHTSLMAHPAFLTMGYEVIKRESVSFNGAKFERFEMYKRL